MAFEAKYRGECGECGNAILVGQTVTFQGDDGVVHLHCPKPRKICPRCFIEMPATGVCPDCDE